MHLYLECLELVYLQLWIYISGYETLATRFTRLIEAFAKHFHEALLSLPIRLVATLSIMASHFQSILVSAFPSIRYS